MDEDRPPNPRPGPIVERFRSSVEEEDDVVRVYEELLSDLTFNSKPIITELTIIAGERREHAEDIADSICERILGVPVDQKLPSLYLLDSIVKNLGHEYVKHFAARLPKVFCVAYNQVHPNMHQSMRHLFRTWSQVFPSSVLRKIEDELQFSNTESQRSAGLVNVRNSESPSPRPSHGIHVNPKYLEARRQFQHSSAPLSCPVSSRSPSLIGAIGSQKTVHSTDSEEDGLERFTTESSKGWSGASPKFHDIEDSSGNSSRMHVNGHIPSVQYGEYDSAYWESAPPHLGRSKVASGSEVEEPIRHFNVKVAKPLSSSKLMVRRSASPVDERLTGDGAPWRASDRASSSYPRLGFGPDKLVNHNGWLKRSFPSDMGRLPQPDASSAYDPSIGYSKKHPRELINAYGSYKEQNTSFEKHPKLQRIEVNGLNREATTRNWRSFEEEEYVWEDMSPTLASRSGRNSLPSLGHNSGVVSRRVGLGRPDVGILEPDIRSNNWFGQSKLRPFDDPARIVDDRIPVSGSVHASMHTRALDGRGGPNEPFGHNHSSYHVQDPGKFPYNFQHPSRELASRSQGWSPQLPSRASGTAAGNAPNLPGLSDNSSDVELPFQRLSHIRSDSSNGQTSVLEKQLALRPFSPPAAPVTWPPVHNSQHLPVYPIPQNLNHPEGVILIESSKPVYQGPNRAMFLPHQQFEPADRETPIPNKLLPLPQQQPGLMHTNRQINEQDVHGGYIPSVSGQLSSHMLAQPHRMQMHGQGTTMISLPNSLSGMTSLVAGHNISNTSSLAHGGIVPSLPPGPLPGPSHMGPAPQNTGPIVSGPPVSAFSGLIGTLMAQGLISLTTLTRSEDSLGLDFNAELLKVRHESAINALYTNLSRQCTTCGLRFKFQEEHSSHMDWHVTKNRISKNRKQKPSRKWFVNTKEWLSGAETVGTDVVPFLPTEVVLEKKEDKEMAVPADEDQTVCALCGEPFEDFYSDEAEEWMYRGAVYMNAPNGYTDSLDRSQLGPIVHAKCRSDSNAGS